MWAFGCQRECEPVLLILTLVIQDTVRTLTIKGIIGKKLCVVWFFQNVTFNWRHRMTCMHTRQLFRVVHLDVNKSLDAVT